MKSEENVVPRNIRELLFKRKGKLTLYLIAAFFPVLGQVLTQSGLALSLGLAEVPDGAALKWRLLLIILIIPAPSILHYLSRMMRIGYMRDTLLDVRKLAFRRILHIPTREFVKHSRDSYLSQLVNDINLFENDFFLSLLNAIFNAGICLLGLAMLFYFDWRFAIYACIATTTVSLIGRLFENRTTDLKLRESNANEHYSLQMNNVFNGLEIVRLNRVEDLFEKRALGFLSVLESVKLRFHLFTDFQKKLMETLGSLFSFATIFYIGFGLSKGSLSLTRALMIAQMMNMSVWSMVGFFPFVNRLKASRAIFDKIVRGDEQEEKVAERGTSAFSLEKELRATDLSFSFGEHEILKNASFRLEAGKKYLLKGVSGSGKTTLLNLLAGLYEPDKGQITYDGRTLAEIDPASQNRAVAEIYQDVFLFEDTLRNNINLYQEVSEESLAEAVERAGLKDLVESLPEGLDSRLEENGRNLSGGERQRVSIARATVRRASLLLADEASSSLDETLGRKIEETLLSLDATVLAISHRFYEGLSDRYDAVLELVSGRLQFWPTEDYFGQNGGLSAAIGENLASTATIGAGNDLAEAKI